MNVLFEKLPAAGKEDPLRMEYVHAMTDHVIHNEPFALEELLLQQHDLVMGELEAYNWLHEVMGDQVLRVQLDTDGYHVIPRPEGEGGLRQD